MRKMLIAAGCLIAAMPLGDRRKYDGVAMILPTAEEGAPADKEPPFKDGEP